MRTEHYKIKCIRLSEETWSKLKDKRKKSGKSWNLFLLDLLSKRLAVDKGLLLENKDI